MKHRIISKYIIFTFSHIHGITCRHRHKTNTLDNGISLTVFWCTIIF